MQKRYHEETVLRLAVRLTLAFLLAPLIAPFVVALVLISADFIFHPNSAFSGFYGIGLALLFGASTAYLNAAIVAIPVLCLVGPRNLKRPWLLVMFASISGGITIVVLGRQQMNLGFIGLGALAGFTSAWVFWYIGLRPVKAT